MNYSTRKMILTAFTLILGLLVSAGAGYLVIATSATGVNVDTEVRTGLLVVVAIAVLMTLLFILAAGFSALELADGKQPLGLPEGSIRAMIALVLIMVFIIFGIYLFRIVGNGKDVFVGNFEKIPGPEVYPGKIIISAKDAKATTYSVWVNDKITEDGVRLAQQLLTTVGTLVVAVSGFYFGSSSTSSLAGSVGRFGTVSPRSAITKVSPQRGKTQETIELDIEGADLNSPKAVFLRRGEQEIKCFDVLSSESRIRCKALLIFDPGDPWDIVVEHYDSGPSRLEKAFTIDAR